MAADPEAPLEPSGDERRPEAPDTSASFMTLGLVFYGVLAAAGVIWRLGFYDEPIFYASSAAAVVGLSPVRDVVLGLAVAGALIGLSELMTRAAWGDRLARAMAEALGGLSVPDALLLAFASGIAEEVFFRGALQPRVGWVAASVLFGCVHFVPRREFVPWTVFAIAAGFCLGALFEWTGSLLAPITAHVAINAVNLPLLVKRYGPTARS